MKDVNLLAAGLAAVVTSALCTGACSSGNGTDSVANNDALEDTGSYNSCTTSNTIDPESQVFAVTPYGLHTSIRTGDGEEVVVNYVSEGGMTSGLESATATFVFRGQKRVFPNLIIPPNAGRAGALTSMLFHSIVDAKPVEWSSSGLHPEGNNGAGGNHSGCDIIGCIKPVGWTQQWDTSDCGPSGACCDQHDECINTANCGFSSGTGGLPCTTPQAAGDPNCPAACRACQRTVMACIASNNLLGPQPGTPTGPSGCCNNWGRGGNVCGQPQQCSYTNSAGVYIIETNQCVCVTLGLGTTGPNGYCPRGEDAGGW